MRKHRDQVEGRRRVRARIPQCTEIFTHPGELGDTLVLRMHYRIRRIDIGDRDVGPPGQFGSVLPREIE
jgi:hypothetical protein